MPRKNFLPFSRPDVTEAEIAAVVEVLRSGWITTGKRTTEFEERFADYVGAPGAVAVTSATAGLHLLLHALDVGPGDEVITPSMTWVSTINLIVLAGATPVFVDVDRDTLMAPPDAILERVTERTKLIVPVHFAGAPADVDPLYEVATQRGIAIVEDAAHAAGTEYRGRRIGQRGTSVFSFHPIKNMTCGEGGMVCSDDAELLTRLRRLKFHGLGADAFARETQGRAPQTEVIEPGFKYNLTDIASALGLGQLSRIDELNRRRTELAEHYLRRLPGVPAVLPLARPDWPHRHAWHLMVVRLDTQRAGITREVFMEELKRRNVGTGIHFRAAHRQRYYRDRRNLRTDLPATEWNSDRICSLPLFPGMTEADVTDVMDAVEAVLRFSK